MNDTPSDDDTRPFGTPEADPQRTEEPAASAAQQPVRQPEAPRVTPPAGQPGPPPWPYAGPYGVSQYPGQPAYPGYPPPQRPKFSDQVLGMRAVVAVALVALVIGGLGGALLGALSGGNDDAIRFGGPGGFQQGGTFGQMPNQGQLPQQQFGQSQP
jgi:hypothetical protein